MASVDKKPVIAGKGAAVKMSALESKLNKVGLDFCQKSADKMIPSGELFKRAGLPHDSSAGMEAINGLLRKHLCSAHIIGTEIRYEWKTRDEAKAVASLDTEERLVLNLIKDVNNYGIWVRDVTTRTGLPSATVNKVLKTLEQKKQVKQVKSIKHPTKRIYMLYNITPHVDLSGGPWFTDNELDSEFIATIKDLAFKFIQNESTYKGKKDFLFPTSATPYLPTVSAIRDFVAKAIVGDVLKDSHVEQLLQLLIYEGAIEKILVMGVKSQSGVKRDAESDAEGDEGEGAKRRKVGKDGKSIKVKDAKRKRAKREAELAAKKKRQSVKKRSTVALGAPGADDDSDDESTESDFDSDEEARPSGAGKSNRRRKKRRVQAASSDDEGGDRASDVDSVSSLSGSDDGRNGLGDDDDDEHNLNDFVYRVKRSYRPVIGWTDMPCGVCPVEQFCSESGQVPSWKRPATKLRDGATLEGVGMLGGAGAAIGISGERWGEVGGKVGTGVSPVNPRDCHYFAEWLRF